MADSTVIRQTLLSILASQFAEISFKNNVIDRLLLQPATTIYTKLMEDIDSKLNAFSLQAIASGSVDNSTALEFLRGLGVAIGEGTYATGSAFVIVSSPSVITVPADTEFTTASGLKYKSTSNVRAIPSENYRLDPDDKLLVPAGSYYYFDVPLKADSVGAAYNIQENTVLTTTLEIQNLYKILSSTFSGGSDPETAKDAAGRILRGVGIGGFANNKQLLALLRTTSTNEYYDNRLSGTISVSIVGANDAEMQRDRRGILPVSIGGKVDIYVRTSKVPLYATKRVTATLIGINASGDGIWAFTIQRELCPSTYNAVKVRAINSLPDSSGYEIVSQTILLDTSSVGFPFIPDIANTTEATFSSFHEIRVEFIDTDTEVLPEQIGNRTNDYYVTVRYMPVIDSAQKYLSCNGIRPVGLDVLVKAPFVCDVSTRIRLNKSIPQEITNIIKGKVSEFINSLDFNTCVRYSDIAALIKSLLPSDVHIAGITFGGSILLPNLTSYVISFSDSLCVPTLASYGVSAKNTILAQDTQHVSVLVS